jgi:hypothetical protein
MPRSVRRIGVPLLFSLVPFPPYAKLVTAQETRYLSRYFKNGGKITDTSRLLEHKPDMA